MIDEPRPAVSKWLWITLIIVVIAAGIFAAWYFLMGPGKNSEVETKTPITTKKEDANTETANWKKYNNESYNYSIKYPPQWTQKHSNSLEQSSQSVKDSSIVFSSNNTAKMTINVTDKTKTTDVALEDFAANSITPKDKVTVSDSIAYKVGSNEGLRKLVTMSESKSEGLWYFTDDENYFVTFITTEKTASSDITTMLSTFKFTGDSVETADLKTYENKDLGISFSYPSNWNLSEGKMESALVYLGLDEPGNNPKPDTDMPNSANIYLYESASKLDTKNRNVTSLEDYLNKYAVIMDPATDPVYEDVEVTKIGSFDGYEAKADPNGFAGGKHYFIELQDKKIVHFWLKDEKNLRTLQSIFASFKVD